MAGEDEEEADRDGADDRPAAVDESDRDAPVDGDRDPTEGRDPPADDEDAGDPNADQDAPVTAVGWISGFAIAALALADGNPAHVVVLGGLVGVVGVATWVAIRRGRERDAARGQVAVALVAVGGAGAALADRAYLLAAAFGLVAVMLAGRVFEKWRA